MTPLDKIRDAHRLSSGKDLTGTNPYSGFCPAHDDRKRSLSVTINEAGNALVYCHTGCDTERDVLSAWGMGFRDLYPEPVTDKFLATVKNVEREMQRESESKPTKYVDLYEETKAWVEGLPEDYEDPTRDEYKDGWKAGWKQVVYREWDSVVSLVENSTKRKKLDLGPIIFEACRATAAAYRTRNGSWDVGAGAKLLTYARKWATIPAIQAEIKAQLNGSETRPAWVKVLDPDMVDGVPFEETVQFAVPPPIPTPRVCLMCGEDISHLRLDARFCDGTCRKRNSRDHVPEGDVEETIELVFRMLFPLGAASEDQEKQRVAFEYLAFKSRGWGARIKFLEGLMCTTPGRKHIEEAMRIRERGDIETRHQMMNWEQHTRRPWTKPTSKKEGHE